MRIDPQPLGSIMFRGSTSTAISTVSTERNDTKVLVLAWAGAPSTSTEKELWNFIGAKPFRSNGLQNFVEKIPKTVDFRY